MIKCHQTLVSNGFNIKLNDSHGAALKQYRQTLR